VRCVQDKSMLVEGYSVIVKDYVCYVYNVFCARVHECMHVSGVNPPKVEYRNTMTTPELLHNRQFQPHR